ncbi:MAG: sigma-70 family RNA polymerase sigma factor [Candidatus Omnitrophota bacterium]
MREAQNDYLSLRKEGFEDLLQECLIHWFFMKDQFRAESGASERTFLNRITRNKIADLIRRRDANKRKVLYVSKSLDEMDGDGESINTKEKILMVEEQIVSKVSAANLPEAMSKVTAGLSFRQKQICRYLSEGMSQVKVGEIMKIPRATLQDEIKRIREVFRKAGLEEFLR